MKAELKSSDGLKREFEVELPAEKVDDEFKKLYELYRKKAKIKGFRPGKTPINVIKQMYGDSVKGEALQELISKSYPKALKELDLKAAAPPEIGDFELNEGQPLKYTATIEVMPVIDKVNFEGLKLPDDKAEVRDPEVQAVVDFLRKKQSIVSKVQRAAKKDDIVLVDLVKLEDPNNVINIKEFKDNEIDLSGEMSIPEFREGLIGTKAGDEKEIMVNYPADYSAEMLRGQSIKYLCQVKEVKERILPEENDEFAKKQGENIGTTLELRLKIREDLAQQKAMDQRQWRKNELKRQSVEINKFDLPDSMVDNYVESMIEKAKEENPKFDGKGMKEYYRQMAEDGIRWSLLLDSITRAEKIEVLPSDTENWIKGFALSNKLEMEKAKEVLMQSGRIQEIRDAILEDKVFDFLMTKTALVPQAEFAPETAGPEEKKTTDKDTKLTEEK